MIHHKVCWLLVIGLALLVCPRECLTQEFDTVVSTQNRKPYTILDQIPDPQERAAFRALFDKRPAGEKAGLAEAFLAKFPQSWLLAQVYEIAAKAYIDLEDFNRALGYGKESLRLLPENPLLLVPLANVQAQRSLWNEARVNALSALDLLDRFARPSAIPERDWPQIERQLRASSNFALGRAYVAEALSLQPVEKRQAFLRKAEEFLVRAREFNPEDPEIHYLMGLNYLTLGKTETAAVSFATVCRIQGILQDKAYEQLQRIYQSSFYEPKTSFEAFLGRLKGKEREFALKDSLKAKGKERQWSISSYAGSQACLPCHSGQHQTWQRTGMARMFRPYSPENVIGDFGEGNEFYAGDEVLLAGGKIEVRAGKERFLYARMSLERGRHYFKILQDNGQWVRYPIDYTIGSKWQQAYATRLPNGQIHVFPFQYNALHKRWINFWKIIDPEESERADVRTFEKFGLATSYQANCAVCHTSQLRNTAGGGFEIDHLNFKEPGINCEMCHGPSGEHVSAMMAGKPYAKQPIDPPVDFDHVSNHEYVAVCSQCHMQSAMREPGPHGELNFSGKGDVFFQRSKSRLFSEFSRKAVYKDGRFRETTFIVESLQRSACFKKGQAHCGHCHDPHERSLKFLDRPDQMCLQCHSQLAGAIEKHTLHSAQSEASRCVSCHMPRIMNSLLFQARTHQIDDTPNATMTLRFGPQDSPNACLLCHSNKNPEWVQRQLQQRQKPKGS